MAQSYVYAAALANGIKCLHDLKTVVENVQPDLQRTRKIS